MKYDTRKLKELFNSVRFVRSPHVLFQPGRFILSDGVLQVTIPWESEINGMVSADIIPFINAITKPEIEIELEERHLRINTAKIRLIPESFFQGVGLLKTEDSFTIYSELIKEAILKTYYVASREESRFLLNGIYWDNKGIISSDSTRISIFDFTSPIAEGINIPARTAPDLVKIFFQENITVSIGGGILQFTSQGKGITSRLLDGTFPNIRSKLENTIPSISVDRIKLLACLKRILVLQSKEELDQKIFKISIGDDIKIEAHGELGSLEEHLKIEWLTEPIESSNYFRTPAILESIANLNSERVSINLDQRLCLFDSDQEQLIYLPMRVLNG